MSTYDLNVLRKRYEAAIQDAKAAADWWEEMKGYSGNHAVVLAYQATAKAILARHDWNPYHKLSYLKESMKRFRKAVKLQPDNVEIRFLRFAIQHYLPEFLGQSGDLERDKAILKQHIPRYEAFDLAPSHVHTFLEFFEVSERFTQDELEALRAYIPPIS